MNIKSTIATMALVAAASNAHALRAPIEGELPVEQRTICLSIWEQEDGSMSASDCDESLRNERWGRKVLENGCAEGQAAMHTVNVQIRSCPTFVQL